MITTQQTHDQPRANKARLVNRCGSFRFSHAPLTLQPQPKLPTLAAATAVPALSRSIIPMKLLLVWFLALSSSCLHAIGATGETEITISGFIDGSDEFAFTPGKITWTHKHWGEPTLMTFEGDRWADLQGTPEKWLNLKGLDIAKAHIVRRSGRDTIALETNRDGFVLYFCDSPNGGESYSVTIAIPAK